MNFDVGAERLRIAVVAAVVAFPCFGQPPQSEAGTIRIDASVTEHGNVVTDLTQADFLIRDEGEPRSAVAFASEGLPLDVVLLCQFVHVPPDGKYLPDIFQPPPNSAVLRASENKNRAAIEAFQYFSKINMNSAARALEGLRPEDRAAVISFGLDPQIEQPLTSDRGEIAAAIERLGTRSGLTVSGSNFMAMEWGLRMLAKERERGPESKRRSAIFIVSFAGSSNPAMFNDEPAIFRLWQENTALSFINTGRFSSSPSGIRYRLDNMAHIAAETGGSVVVMPTDDFPDLLARLRSSYSLWFRPLEAKPGTVRRVTVELTEEAKKRYPGAEIQARKGYVVR